MNSAHPTREATYDDIVALPEHVVGGIVDGELFVSPRPAPRHAKSRSRLTAKIGSAFDRQKKMKVYAAEGIPDAWIVDPLARTVEVFRLEKGHWVAKAVHGGDAQVRIPPFDAIELDLSLFRDEPAGPPRVAEETASAKELR